MSSYCKEGIKLLALKAVVKDVVIKQLDAIDLPEDKEIVVYAPKEKGGEDRSSFFFPSAFDFWNDAREEVYQQYIEKGKKRNG